MTKAEQIVVANFREYEAERGFGMDDEQVLEYVRGEFDIEDFEGYGLNDEVLDAYRQVLAS